MLPRAKPRTRPPVLASIRKVVSPISADQVLPDFVHSTAVGGSVVGVDVSDVGSAVVVGTVVGSVVGGVVVAGGGAGGVTLGVVGGAGGTAVVGGVTGGVTLVPGGVTGGGVTVAGVLGVTVAGVVGRGVVVAGVFALDAPSPQPMNATETLVRSQAASWEFADDRAKRRRMR